MQVIICAACNTLLGYLTTGPELADQAKALAAAHKKSCLATEDEYEQAVYDLKFRQITGELDL